MLFDLAVAPVLILSFYIYIRDKYEKEPVRLLIVSLMAGMISASIIYILQVNIKIEIKNQWIKLFYLSFISSAGIEEGVKFIFLFFLIWKNKNFNEPFDGIVYGAFLSLGFAGIENYIYVFHPIKGGYNTAILRGIFSVPGHGLFGTAMGYHMGMKKFPMKGDKISFFSVFFSAWVLHGIYNAIVLSGYQYYLLIFLPYFFFLCLRGLLQMRKLLCRSPFK
ncbi:MAG: PrsW family intramembrane metalloprotease [Clostridiales bacterium]|nr:PrsW family intramembrane metalloprotease [Clostridiales bacterium]